MRNFNQVLSVTDHGKSFEVVARTSKALSVTAPDIDPIGEVFSPAFESGEALSVEARVSFFINSSSKDAQPAKYLFQWEGGEYETTDAELADTLIDDPRALQAVVDENSINELY